jgi:polyketide synthase 12/myxalamid-type polyketide synthase MxaB/epothilone polyketide synthase D
MVAQADRARRLESRGILSFTPEQGMDMLGQLLRQDRAQVAVMPVNWRQLLKLHSTASELPLLSDLLREQAAATSTGRGSPKEKGGAMREALLAAPPEERRQLLESHLRAQVARVVGMSASKLDVQQPLNRLGIDSLMAVELKNRIELDLGTTIPVAKLLQGPSVALLTDELLASLPASPSEDDAAKVAQLLDQLDQLSEDEVKAILEQKTAIPATVTN